MRTFCFRPRSIAGAAVVMATMLGACGSDGASPATTGDTTAQADAADTAQSNDASAPDAAADAIAGDATGDVSAPDALTDTGPDTEDAQLTDTKEDIADEDAAPDTTADADAGEDVPPPLKSDPWVPPDGALYGRIAQRSFPLPVGFPTAGYGQKSVKTWSPFVDHFEATDTLHTEPGVKVVVLHSGGERIILAKVDMIGVFGGMLRTVSNRLSVRFDQEIAEELIIGATHTHAGPGRFVAHILSALVADEFDPEFYDAIISTVTDTIAEAIEGEGVPVAVGHTLAYTDRLHNDRRCENPELEEGTMGIVRIDHADGTPMAVIVNYAMHGTVFGYDNRTLSTDAPGAVELKVEEQFDTPVMAMYLQSWAGDMSPANPTDEYPLPDLVSEIDGNATQLEALGQAAAETVMGAWDQIVTTTEAEIGTRAASVPFGLDVMGYAAGDWPHPTGGAYCGGAQSTCDGTVVNMKQCLDIPSEHTIWETRVSAARIGDLVLVTLPGEPVTPLGLSLRDAVREATGYQDVLVVGYAQDYTGYLLEEDDWWMGGYEGGSNFWGPRQGDWIAAWSTAVAKRLVDPGAPLPAAEGTGVEPLEVKVVAPRVPTASPDFGQVVQEPGAIVPLPETVQFSWTGGDPLVDRPSVVLEQEGPDDAWAPFIGVGTRFTQAGYEMTLELSVDPPYEKGEQVTERTFTWVAALPTARRIPSTSPPLEGAQLRLRVVGAAANDGVVAPYEVVSQPFKVVYEGP